jgi:hypothetical protein
MKRFPVIFLTLISASAKEIKLPDVVDFNDHIQPLISEKCYHCHGPDSSTRAHRRKTRSGSTGRSMPFWKASNGEPSIIKGDAEASEFFKRIIDLRCR